MATTPEDAVSLLRSLRAAGEKTGAVEAEGALHLRRNSRRTMDGIHDATATLVPAGAAASLPAPKFPSSSGASSQLASATTSGAASAPGTAHSSGSNGNPVPAATTGSAGPPSSPLNSVISAVVPISAALPLIRSTSNSPAASPSRLAIRSPAPLGSLPSPTGMNSSPTGSTAGVASAGATNPGSFPGSAPIGSPSSPSSQPVPISLSPTPHRRSSYLSHESSGLPYTHGSPLPHIFDSPFNSTSAAGPAALAVPGSSGAPPSSSLRPSAPGPASPTPASVSASLPSIGGGNVAVVASSSPYASVPAPMPSMLTAATGSRIGSGRVSSGAAALTAAAAGGGVKPLPPSPSSPSGSSPAAASSPTAASGTGRPFRTPGHSSPGLALPAALGSPGASGGGAPTAGAGTPAAMASSPNRISFSLPDSERPSLELPRQHPLVGSIQRPGSARSGPGGPVLAGGMGAGAAGSSSDGMNASLSLRRLSMTGGLELTLGGSQKLVMAAAHELSSITQHGAHSQHGGYSQQGGSHGGASPAQLPSPLQLQQLQGLLPPPPSQRQGALSARRASNTVSGGVASMGAAPAGPGGVQLGAPAGASQPKAIRDARLSDPGLAGPAGGGGVAGGNSGGEAAGNVSAGRPSLAPLPSSAVSAARAATPPTGSSSPGLGPYVPTPMRAQRPDPLPTSARQASVGGVSASSAAALSVSYSAESSPTARAPTPLSRAGALAPMPAATAAATSTSAAASTAGPVAESALEDTPDLDPAALFRPSLASRPDAAMELTVRALATAGTGGAATPASAPVQSSVRQKLQADPLRFHPPTAAMAIGPGGIRRQVSDPLEATPRLVLGVSPQHRHLLPHLDCSAYAGAGGGAGGSSGSGGGASPGRLAAGAAGPSSSDLWVPNQDILPMVARTNSASGNCARWHPAAAGGAAGAGGGGAGGGGCGSLTFSPFRGAASPGGAGAGGSSGSLDLPTPRLRTVSANGINAPGTPNAATPAAASAGPPGPRQHPSPQAGGHQPQPPALQAHPSGLQSNYLKSLAAAAGLDGGDGSGRRARSLSDSGCAAFLAAADCGPVGLSLEGGLSVLGVDIMSRIQAAERHHNTRYSSSAVGVEDAAGDLSGTLDEAESLKYAGEKVQALAAQTAKQPPKQTPAAAERTLRDAAQPRTPTKPPAPPAAAAATPPSGSGGSSDSTATRPGIAAPRGGATAGSPAAALGVPPGTLGAGPDSTAGHAIHSPVHVRLEASVSSLPLKALKPLQGGGAAAGKA